MCDAGIADLDAEDADLPIAGPDDELVVDAAGAAGRQGAVGADDRVRRTRMWTRMTGALVRLKTTGVAALYVPQPVLRKTCQVSARSPVIPCVSVKAASALLIPALSPH